MLNSRSIDDLRSDVAVNCRVWLDLCHAEGLDVVLSNTRRDNEYQASLYAQGRTKPGKIVTNSKTTTFHGAGLAIDFYSKSKGWSDHAFFVRCGKIAKRVGFSWAGDWKSFVEYCHIQWDNGRASKHSNAPVMPRYEEEIEMTKQEVQAMIDVSVRHAIADYEQAINVAQSRAVSPWATGEWADAKRLGLMDGTNPARPVLREQQAAVAVRLYKLCTGGV